MKLRILHLTHTDLRFDNRILKELKSLSMLKGIEVMAVGVRRDSDNGATQNVEEGFIVRNLNLYALKLELFRVLKFQLFFFEYFFKVIYLLYRYRPDVIHCHDTLILPIGFIYSYFTRSKLIYDAHELESDKFGQGWLLGRITLYVEKWCWKRIDGFITVSEGIKDWYFDHLGPKKVVVIYNAPYYVNITSGNEISLKQRFSIPIESKCFVFVGALERGRRIEEILRSFSVLDDSFHVVFIGFGSLKNEIVSYSLNSGNIHYHEPVSHEMVRALIRGSYAGFCLIENISLSDYLSMPNKLFEYVNAGVPVIVFDNPDLSNFVSSMHIGYIFNEEMSLFDQIRDLNVDIKIEDSASFSWMNEESKLIEFYKTL